MPLDADRLALQIAERIREKATRQGRIPFLRGDLRKSVIVLPAGAGAAYVGSNLPYARAVHDGRPALVIRPKTKKALHWGGEGGPVVKQVVQKARKGKPYLAEAIEELQQEGLGFLSRDLEQEAIAVLETALRRQGLTVKRSG